MPRNYYLSLFLLTFLCGVAFSTVAFAQQDKDPALPPTLQTLSEQGAQVRYLGKEYGLDGWVTIKGGQEQYFYVTPNGDAMVMGLMFDKSGKMITLRQVNELRQEKGGEVLDLFATPEQKEKASVESVQQSRASYKSPSEQLFDDLESSNWVMMGKESAPVVYTFMDPQCPHCHNFMRDIRQNYIDNGLVQVRMIPVGFRNETLAQAAFLLSAPDPQSRWYRHLDGDENALPVTKSINQQGVERNMSIMQSWKFNVTPLSVYRSGDGEIKIIQGRVKDIPSLISDL